MADALNTVQTVTGNPSYGKTTGGFKKSVPELRKYEKALLKFLTTGERLAHGKYLVHKSMPKNMGDTLNLRRYFDIEADPRQLKLDKNTTTGPDLKELQGAAVEFKLEWYANGIQFNDVVTKIHLDSLMSMAMPKLMANAKVVMDNVAALAMYEGSSKAFVKAYDATKVASVTLGTAASTAEAAGPLNHDILRFITSEMIANTETYTTTAGTVTVRAKIKGFDGSKYRVLVSENGMDDLLDDEKFLKNFVRGISAEELRQNKIVSTFRYILETIDNHLTIKGSDQSLQVNGSGDLEVAFVLGQEFGADVKLAGEGVKLFKKLPDTVDSNDKYGRVAFVTYKLAYNAQVVNSMAITAVVYTPNSNVAAGTITAPATSFPQV